ncbi:unnamed protein product [Cuscuta campestris]|uniref:Uncharacterized protein n=1 Tax=Cuscuta campestris TaxID=132261 RepID=A0A484MH62_9ASTE|nr:unnamed protein product [Cuscuta campestris]
MSSQGPVQVSPLSCPRTELPRTKHPVMAPQSPDDESPLKKPPPNSLLHAPIAPGIGEVWRSKKVDGIQILE